MKVNNINKLSFGTKPLIGDNQSYRALPKYGINIANGILNAFERLSKNGIDDQLVINMGRNTSAKRIDTDILDISYWKNNEFISSKTLSPKTLSKLSSKKISTLIMRTYKQLQASKIKENVSMDWAVQKGIKKISKRHISQMKLLIDKFGYDDWTCL